MELETALRCFHKQKENARSRGIGWELSFKQWVEWWGEDLDRRGCRADQLQMQRFADTGPYALGNIRKGYPRDNAKTTATMRLNRLSELAKASLERLRDETPAESCDFEGEPDDVVGHGLYGSMWNLP